MEIKEFIDKEIEKERNKIQNMKNAFYVLEGQKKEIENMIKEAELKIKILEEIKQQLKEWKKE
ncbi:MAG: hypothetical protein ABIL45_03600 [candidate division WOR-3 bacterium]